ncbi:MAG TPA: hypothetical protein DDX98_15420 [Bacteroidales bacterium]|nr:hypothetical protein [Bacteroidales bacterium]
MWIGLILLFVIGLIVTPKVKQFFKIDSCLDSGGRLNYETETCEHGDTVNINTDSKIFND